MAMGLVFGTMAHEGNGLAPGQLLKEAEGEFLAVVFDGAVAAINCAAFKQFLPITATELGPREFPGQEGAEEGFAGAEICHPNIIARTWQAASAKAGGQDS